MTPPSSLFLSVPSPHHPLASHQHQHQHQHLRLSRYLRTLSDRRRSLTAPRLLLPRMLHRLPPPLRRPESQLTCRSPLSSRRTTHRSTGVVSGPHYRVPALGSGLSGWCGSRRWSSTSPSGGTSGLTSTTPGRATVKCWTCPLSTGAGNWMSRTWRASIPRSGSPSRLRGGCVSWSAARLIAVAQLLVVMGSLVRRRRRVALRRPPPLRRALRRPPPPHLRTPFTFYEPPSFLKESASFGLGSS